MSSTFIDLMASDGVYGIFIRFIILLFLFLILTILLYPGADMFIFILFGCGFRIALCRIFVLVVLFYFNIIVVINNAFNDGLSGFCTLAQLHLLK